MAGSRPIAAIRAICAMAILVAVAVPTATAQESRDVQALTQKIDRLQGELNDLQRKVYGGDSQAQDTGGSDQSAQGNAGAAAGDGMTTAAARRLRQRMESLENDIRRITGQLQETRHQLQETTERLDKLVTDVDYRLRELEDFKEKVTARLDSLGDGSDAEAAEGGDGQADGSQTARAEDTENGAPASASAGEGDGEPDTGDNGSAGAAGEQSSDGGGSGSIGTVSQDAVDQLRAEAEQSATADAETGDGTDDSSNADESGAGEAGSADSGGDAGDTQTAAAASGADALPDAPPQAQYDHAFKLLSNRDYAKAEKALRAFVEAHPEHELAGNAKYWLGETYYVRGQYNQAAVVFAEAFRTYPDSRKAPDNLLKLGITLAKIDKVDKACRLFSELKQRFPDAAQNIRHRADREQERLACGDESGS